MELCFLKSNALDTLKNGLPQIFDKYLTEGDNSWLVDVCGENPFVKFRDVPDFELTSLDNGLQAGEIEFRNCKILYKHLNFLTPRQAADERFWAGLCHGVFYNYLRRRYEYDNEKENHPKAVSEIKTRFFFEQLSRTGILRNSLAKCWWTGRAFYDSTLSTPFEKLDIVGSNDISSKISYILRYPFASNPKILDGIVKFFKHFKDRDVKLGALKETLQPAMAELNKVGGAVILDCLTADEVAAIIIACVEDILKRKHSVRVKTPVPKEIVKPVPKVEVKPAPKVDDTRTTVTVDKTVKPPPKVDVKPVPKIDDTRMVQFGNTVKVVSLDNGRQRTYKITEKFKNQFTDIHDELVGKAINSVVTIRDDKFTITDIK